MDNKKSSFESIGLSPWICKQMSKLGIKSPTAIQENCIPEIVNIFLLPLKKFKN